MHFCGIGFAAREPDFTRSRDTRQLVQGLAALHRADIAAPRRQAFQTSWSKWKGAVLLDFGLSSQSRRGVPSDAAWVPWPGRSPTWRPARGANRSPPPRTGTAPRCSSKQSRRAPVRRGGSAVAAATAQAPGPARAPGCRGLNLDELVTALLTPRPIGAPAAAEITYRSARRHPAEPQAPARASAFAGAIRGRARELGQLHAALSRPRRGAAVMVHVEGVSLSESRGLVERFLCGSRRHRRRPGARRRFLASSIAIPTAPMTGSSTWRASSSTACGAWKFKRSPLMAKF